MTTEIDKLQDWYEEVVTRNGETFTLLSSASQNLSALFAGYAKRQMERNIETASKLSSIRTIATLTEIQANHLRETLQDLAEVQNKTLATCMNTSVECGRQIQKNIPQMSK